MPSESHLSGQHESDIYCTKSVLACPWDTESDADSLGLKSYKSKVKVKNILLERVGRNYDCIVTTLSTPLIPPSARQEPSSARQTKVI